MTKAKAAEKQEAIDRLREWIKPGDTVYTVLEHVSRSGMQREIRVVLPYVTEESQNSRWTAKPTIDFWHPNHAIATALGMRQGKRDGLIVGGCGMDMGFHVVYELSHTLYGGQLHKDIYLDDARTLNKDGTGPLLTREGAPEGYVYIGGYQCLGKGQCPSNYHSNHRDRIRCEGPEGPGGPFCYKPDLYSSRYPVPEGWPMLTLRTCGDSIEVPAACITRTVDGVEQPPVICSACKGVGDLPNPEGPERFDLLHTDGYALRHKWL